MTTVLTLQQLAVCVQAQWFKERQRVRISTNVQCDLININQPISFSVFMNNNKPP